MANFEVSIAENNIDVVLDELSKSEEAILEAIGLQAESYAKLKCPVKTGLLRNSITHAIGGKGAAETQYQDDNGELEPLRFVHSHQPDEIVAVAERGRSVAGIAGF